MRFFTIAAFLLTVSLASVQAQTPRTYDDPVPSDQSGITAIQVLGAFERLAYGREPAADTPGRLTRWEQEAVGVHWSGTLGRNGIPGERPWYAEIHAFIDELDDVEGVPRLLSAFDTDSFDIGVVIYARAEVEEKILEFPEEVRSYYDAHCLIFPPDPLEDFTGPVIQIQYDHSIEEVRSCIVTMLVKSMGFIDTEDVEELAGSSIDMTPDHPYLTNLDHYLLRVLYDPRYDPSMPRKEGMATAAKIVADLLP